MNNLHRVPYTCIWSGVQRVALVSVTMLPLFNGKLMSTDQLAQLSKGINSAMRCVASNNDRWRVARVRVGGGAFVVDIYPGQHPDDLARVEYKGDQK